MSRQWLFRVDVAGETDDPTKARGLGHAMKCIALAEEVRNQGGAVQFSVEGPPDVEVLFENRGFPCDVTTDHEAVITAFDPGVIVTDINYLNVEVMTSYRRYATVVNLAPRGVCKYYADISFNSARIEDVPRPPDAPLQEWYTGPEYAILSPEFVALRNNIDAGDWSPANEGIVVQMGGVDQFNLTGTVLEKLSFDRFPDERFTVVAGPFNPHVDELRELCEPHDTVSFVQDPDDFAETLATHALGIFATGISTYEALAVGVPSVNLGLSEFHDSRGKYLERKELSRYLGRYDQIDVSVLNRVIRSLLYSGDQISKMRHRGIDAVDGSACERIVSTVV